MKKSWLLPLVLGLAGLGQGAWAAQAQVLNNTEWTLQSLTGWSVAPLANLSPQPSLNFKGDKIAGSDGCNFFNGAYSLNGNAPNSLRIPTDKMVSTMMGCMGDADTVSRLYAKALEKTTAYRLDGQRLVLLDTQNKVLATLQKAANGLSGTSWQVQEYYDGKSGLVSNESSQRMTLKFEPKRLFLNGNSGCNNYSAQYAINLNKGTLRVNEVGVSRRACAQAGAMKDEADYLRALGKVRRFHRAGSSLALLNEKGHVLVNLNLKPEK